MYKNKDESVSAAARRQFFRDNQPYRHRARYAAQQQQAADKSDPFAHARTLSHIRNGVSEPDDYNVDWRKEVHAITSVASNENIQFTVMVPINMKRP